jgi:hypothetical protein
MSERRTEGREGLADYISIRDMYRRFTRTSLLWRKQATPLALQSVACIWQQQVSKVM